MTAVRAATSHGAASQIVPSGKSDQEQQILLLLIASGVIIFIQHENSGKPQQGTQYAALGVVGFVLLFLAQFWPEVALTFTVLFVVSIVLNSPNGVPLIGGGSGGTGGGSPGATSSVSPQSNKVSTKPINVPPLA
jgi:hypothetical protein